MIAHQSVRVFELQPSSLLVLHGPLRALSSPFHSGLPAADPTSPNEKSCFRDVA